jgi:hypothetical protein
MGRGEAQEATPLLLPYTPRLFPDFSFPPPATEEGAAMKNKHAANLGVIGETIAKIAFFEAGWSPFNRFLDEEKVDLVLRRGPGVYRDVQVKYGRLYRARTDRKRPWVVTSWRLVREDAFDDADSSLFVAVVLVENRRFEGDIFIVPVRAFAALLHEAPPVKGGRRRVCFARRPDGRWVLPKVATMVDAFDDSNSVDVTKYRGNFALLDRADVEAVAAR